MGWTKTQTVLTRWKHCEFVVSDAPSEGGGAQLGDALRLGVITRDPRGLSDLEHLLPASLVVLYSTVFKYIELNFAEGRNSDICCILISYTLCNETPFNHIHHL